MPAELAGIITSTALMCRHRLLDITWKTCRILLRANQDVNLNSARCLSEERWCGFNRCLPSEESLS